MLKVKTPRDAEGVQALKVRPTTVKDITSRQVPRRTNRNIQYGHLIKAMRDTNHIGCRPWEQDVAETLRLVDQQRLSNANRHYEALERSQNLLRAVRIRESELQTIVEEMEAANEELQATNEELQATTEELERTSSYLRTLMDSMLDILMTTDARGVITDVNRATERISGYSRDELIGQPFRQFFTDPERAQAGIQQVRTEGGVSNYDLTVATKDGREIPISYNATVLRGPRGGITGVLGSARDITKSKQAEEKLQAAHKELKESQERVIQSAKMSAVGTLVAGVAHELNNPMMGILNFAQYCLKHTSEDDRIHSVVGDIEREAKRCADIVQNLLTFSHSEEGGDAGYQKESVSVIFDRVFKLLPYRFEEQNVDLTYHTAEDTPKIWMKPNNIQQVFFNLILNALDAIEESEKKEIHVDIHPEGEFVRVTIADSGPGIAPEHLPKIFDPFFTTKPTGEGTGLGLSTSQSIVHEHGGEITCESEPGAGAKFSVLLPVKQKEVGGEKDE